MEEKVVKKPFKKFISKVTNLRYFSLCCWIIGIIVVWEILASAIASMPMFSKHPENYLPHLYEIINSIFTVKSGGTLGFVLVLKAAGNTLLNAFIGFLIGIVLGFILALLMNLSRVVEKIAFPYLMIIQMIPILGMAPIIFQMTGGNTNASRIIIAAILTFYPVSTNCLAGYKQVEKEKHDLMSLCAANTYQKYKKTMIPACMPYFFTGLKIAAPLAITAAILVDTIQTGNSLGCLLMTSQKGGQPRWIFWQIVLFSALIGVCSSGLMTLLEMIVCPYKFGKTSIKVKISEHFEKKKSKKQQLEEVKEGEGVDEISEEKME